MTTFKRFLALSILTVFSAVATNLYAVPAYRGWQTKTQPDGTTITVRQMGDEFFHYWENEAGQQVAKDAEGWWRVKENEGTQSELSKKRQASRRYNKTDMTKPRKAVGTLNMAPRGLVILVNFTDVSFYSGNTLSAMQDLMNAANYNYNGATGSVREYFKAQSNSQYIPDFDVVGPYTLANNRAHYGGNDSDGNDLLPGDMIVEACKAADADGVNFNLYNNDGDTYIDFVYVIYAGAGEADSDVDEAIWPHNWDLASAFYYQNCSYSASQRKVDGLSINNYACSGELRSGVEGSRCAIGTIAHEFGHVLGLPDYYVTSKSASNYGKKYTPGAWSIMDYGSYNNNGDTPPNYSAFDKYYFGWATPNFLPQNEARNVTITTGYNSSYQINGKTTSSTCRTEETIWYLENRQKTGWDLYLPGHGMVAWEVTYNSSDWSGNVPNNTNRGYTIVTANNTTAPYKPYVTSTSTTSTSGTPFPGTSTKTSWTPATGCALTEITESAGSITFKYNGGVNKTKCDYTFDVENCTASPSSGTVAINSSLSVTVTPNSGYSLDDEDCWLVEMGGVLLTYGTDFTYNASTNTFNIPELTDDVYIVASAKPVRTVTWSIQGVTTPINFTDGATLVLPSNPEDCSGTGGKKFVGWTSHSSISGEPDDLFTTAGAKTVTANTTYYAVYATASSGGGSGTPEKASSIAVGDQVVLVCESASVELSGFSSTSTIYGQGSSYSGTPAGTYSFTVVEGSEEGSVAFEREGKYWNWSSGNSLSTSTSVSDNSSWNVTFENGNAFIANVKDSSRKIRWNAANTGLRFACYTSTQTDVQLYKIGAGTSYSDYSLTCGTPCSNTPSMSFTNETVNKTTAEASYTQTVTITGKGSGQTVAYSSSDETVATVNNSGVVTLLGKVGSTTITASVEANGTYCAASASYTLNVSAAPINVTLYYNGTSAILNNQTPPYTLPTTGAYVADMCDGDWTFAGWYNSAYSKSETAPTYITQLTATGSAYAVYTTTETSGGGSGGSVTITTSTENIPTGSYGSANTFTEYTFEGYTFKVQQMYLNSSKLQWRAGGNSNGSGTMYNTQTFPGKISSIVLTYNGLDSYKNFTIKVGDSENPTSGTSITPSISDNVYTFDCSSANADYFVMTNGTYAGYLDQIQINYGGGGSSTTYYATSPECSTTPTIDYTVTWKACGETFHTQGFADGAALVLPSSTPADNAGKTFVGWTATEHHTGAGAPADLFTTAGSKTVTADVTYYAVFH